MSFFGQTFKLGDFKKQINQEFRKKLDQYSQNEHFELFGFSVQGVLIQSSSINWRSTIVNCEILMLGYKSWQNGKLRIQIELESVDVPSPTRYNSKHTTKRVEIQQICLEFCPDEPDVEETPASNQSEINQPESPLDDIRQMMNMNS